MDNQSTSINVANYQSKGFYVLPIKPNQKIPAASIKEFKAKPKLSDNEIAAWFVHQKNNVALLMDKSGLILIDVDLYKNPELQSFLDNSGSTMIQKTPHGGYHLFYLNEGVQYSDTQSDVAVGIDVKSSGYAVVAPSTLMIGDHEVAYQWLTPLTPGPIPDHIKKLLRRKDAGVQVVSDEDSFDLLRRVIVQGFDEGKHNSQIMKIAGLATRATNGASEDFKRQFIHTLAAALDAKDPTPQATSGNLKPTVDAAINYELKRHPTPIEAQGPTVSLLSFSEFVLNYNFKPEYLIEDWIPEANLCLITAPPESYKTWIAIDAAVTVAMGDKGAKFLGVYEAKSQRTPVIFVNQEDHPGRLARRFRTVLSQKVKDAEFTFHTDPVSGLITLDHPASLPIYLHVDAELSFSKTSDLSPSFERLEQRIIETGAKLVVIDPVYSLGGSENFFSDFALKLIAIKGIRTRTGASFLFVHHTKKGVKTLDREGLFGSQLLSGAFEAHIRILRSEEKERTILMTRSGKGYSDQRTPTISITFDINEDGSDPFYRTEISDDAIELTGSAGDVIVGSLQNRGVVSAKELYSILEDTLPQSQLPSKATMYRLLSKGVKSGTLIKTTKGYSIKTENLTL